MSPSADARRRSCASRGAQGVTGSQLMQPNFDCVPMTKRLIIAVIAEHVVLGCSMYAMREVGGVPKTLRVRTRGRGGGSSGPSAPRWRRFLGRLS